ncbi:MAG: MBL fold metallo-hydrolase [Leptospira sp.]|uniref:MBL fold metallo-hydrolase n=1 Tax=Leptospira sp. TaxID=178 RepID=UPI0025B847F1|nr:MBL fold metallo-hydrolase [Leptospira sp.]MBL0954249.1 MBL fold metallo-hydrolase [Leptospira sp.]
MLTASFEYKGIKFEGISEGGIRTSIICPSLDFMFDFGYINPDKIHIGKILLTHAHLDHSCGIPYYVSQRSLRKLPIPKIYVPKALEPKLSQILKLYSEIEEFDYECELYGLNFGDRVDLKPGYFFKPLESFHRVPSQGYTVYETKRKLKKEFLSLHSDEIRKSKEDGNDPTEEISIPLVSFSGDSKIEYVLANEDVRKSKILFMECTYYCEKRDVSRAREWGHTHFDEIVEHASSFENEAIVLIHPSKRYSYRELNDLLRKKVPAILKDRISLFLPPKS